MARCLRLQQQNGMSDDECATFYYIEYGWVLPVWLSPEELVWMVYVQVCVFFTTGVVYCLLIAAASMNFTIDVKHAKQQAIYS